ncbi:MAG: YbhB/YbcL family Raf kinase inhibitor-like protein [Candidatus Omnitrophota bacterium]
MKLTSPSFGNNEYIPQRFSCRGDDLSPELSIKDIPANTKTLALLVVDPDAPAGLWTHWIVYNIPSLSRITEASVPGDQGVNSAGDNAYHGPCPPSGTHRYIFKIFALDTELKFKSPPDNRAFTEAIAGHVIEEAQLTGLFTHK